MNFTFENQGTATYLVYAVQPDDVIDTMSLGMLTNNSISGLAKVVYTQMDKDRYVKYNVSAKVSAKQFLFGSVNKKRLLGVFNGIADAFLSAEEYMIDVNSILLDTDYIFSDVATCDTVLISLPVTNINIGWSDPGTFLRDIMFTTQFDQTENCDYVAQIINYLNSTPVFSPTDFKALLKNISYGGSAPAAKASVPEIIPELQPKPIQQERNVKQVNTSSSVPDAPPPHPKKQPEKEAPARMHTPPSMAIPSSSPQQSNPQIASIDSDEKQIGLMYLLQHYNKKNAELYKAQKAAKKGKKAAPAPAAPLSAPTPKPAKNTIMSPGFAIPGQGNAAPSSAAPDQKAPAPKPMAYATPQPQSQPQSSNAYAPQSQPGSAHIPQPQPVIQTSPVQYQDPPAPVVSSAPSYGGNDADLDSETMILGQEGQSQQLMPHLICKRNSNKIPINKPMLRIGRDGGFNDYVITDNRFIGHSHCHIVTKNGEYFIVDDNSKNHTYLDGALVPSGIEMKLSHGQTIRLANEDFEFRLF